MKEKQIKALFTPPLCHLCIVCVVPPLSPSALVTRRVMIEPCRKSVYRALRYHWQAVRNTGVEVTWRACLVLVAAGLALTSRFREQRPDDVDWGLFKVRSMEYSFVVAD